jgi:hypothetical protein
MMRRVVIVCEGQTEEAFIRSVLCPPFLERGLHLQGITVETSTGHKGGALRYARLLPALRNALAGGHVAAVTTLIDFYKLAGDFPGHATAMAQPALAARLDQLQAALHTDVVQRTGCDPARFLPYIQAHEFEALLFSDVDTLSQVEGTWAARLAALRLARADGETPEHINDGHDTKPSARLRALLLNPSYHKLRHGPIAAERIGLPRIEAECPRFAAWVGRLRTL